MNDAPIGERTHIAFFGRINVGKSSLVNAFTGQELSIVSPTEGATTDPVSKTMELLPLGAAYITDTPGIDDESELGEKRIEKARLVLAKTDIAVIVADAKKGFSSFERELEKEIKNRNLPYIKAYNKADLLDDIPQESANEIWVSAKTGLNITALKEKVARIRLDDDNKPLVADLLNKGDVVVLVAPIDKAAPKGRLILPQQQVIRDALEVGATPLVCRDAELETALSALKKPPKMVITDSQAFATVSKIVPEETPLTSFSILMARYKGDLKTETEGAKAIERLKDGDAVLIAEGCTHHRQCDDIGSVKMPKWICESCSAKPTFEFCSGNTFPQDLTKYALVVHCGGCMLNGKEMARRLSIAKEQGAPIVNYGVAIAHMNGILERTLSPFKA